LNRFQDLEKEYNVVVVLGGRTSSHDSETEITEHYSLDGITKELIHKTAAEFVGIQYQIPPMYSAVKVGGRRLYKFARKGVEIPRPQREIRIFSLAVTDVVMPRVHLNVVCSKGTYIRTLVDDLGKRLGCGAFVESLERARIGTVGLDDAWTLDDLQRYVENHQPAAWKS
jgi:tRNA pseudouridine55 synthase